MSDKLKKIILGSSSLLGLFALTGVAASCGSDSSNKNTGKDGNGTVGGDENFFGGTNLEERIENGRSGAAISPKTQGFDQTSRAETIVAHTFSESGAQSRALNAIRDVYNKLVDANKKAIEGTAEGQEPNLPNPEVSSAALPVKFQNIGSGYPAGANKVSLDIVSKNKSLYDIVLNYTPVASNLAENNMLLSFNSAQTSLNTDLTDFSEKFVSSNLNSEGIDNVSTWVLPAFKSTNVLAINSPVLSYIVKSLKDAGVTVEAGSESFFNEIETKGVSDREGVQGIWGTPVSNISELAKGMVLSKEIFESYDKLIEFASRVQPLFENSKTGTKANVHVFGVDSATSLYTQAVFAELNADPRKMIQAVNKSGGITKVSYQALHTDGSEARIASETIYNKISSAVQSGGVKLLPGGQFSSNDQVKHRYAFSIGSTAGYSHNFINAEQKTIIEYKKDGRIDNTLSFEPRSFDNIPSNTSAIMGISAFSSLPEKEQNKIKRNTQPSEQITKWQPLYVYGGRNNPILAHDYLAQTYTNSENETIKVQLPAFSYAFADAESQQAFADRVAVAEFDYTKAALFATLAFNKSELGKYADYIAKLKELNLYAGTVITKLGNNGVDDPTTTVSILFIVKDAIDTSNENAKVRPLKDSAIEAIATAGYEKITLNKTQILQEEELHSIPTPSKWRKENQYNVIYSQGPSIIGLRSNPVNQDAAKAFVKWLLTTDKKYDFANGNGKLNLTPRDFLQRQMSYILPYKGFEVAEGTASLFGKNEYLKVALSLFGKGATDKDYRVYEEPGSSKAQTFRNSIDAAWEGLQKSVDNQTAATDKIQDFSNFASKIQA
ncbi:P68 family surface lipoprotein [Mycoplasma nasistruthionis]|uniref:P80 family lipoprotein n=1 Tax=Mycoplasma nasistruthionis TaxID=353852 RepID=A0A4Y6I5Z5_9MOLU|nr:P80 family lipoprotein [Mycoplasma nasistruthionis]QDF64772.1 hypothetical protein FIV53_00335 [Mycoplasma nasistruthionis]